jgi:hypothetical protein
MPRVAVSLAKCVAASFITLQTNLISLKAPLPLEETPNWRVKVEFASMEMSYIKSYEASSEVECQKFC